MLRRFGVAVAAGMAGILTGAAPASASDCAPLVRAAGPSVLFDRTEGVEQVKVEIGYRAAQAGQGVRTRYQVIAATLAPGGAVSYRVPGAGEVVSAVILEANGPDCRS